jgi:hypothetical protein
MSPLLEGATRRAGTKRRRAGAVQKAKRLTRLNVSDCNRRQLHRYLRFYRLFPLIVGTLSPQLVALLPGAFFPGRTKASAGYVASSRAGGEKKQESLSKKRGALR